MCNTPYRSMVNVKASRIKYKLPKWVWYILPKKVAFFFIDRHLQKELIKLLKIVKKVPWDGTIPMIPPDIAENIMREYREYNNEMA